MEGYKQINFWCHDCRKDYSLPSTLGWLNSIVGRVWSASCPDCHKTLFRLRDVMANKDPYFRRSTFVKSQLRKHLDDLIQPGDPRFDMLYPQHKKEYEARMEQQEREMYEKTN